MPVQVEREDGLATLSFGDAAAGNRLSPSLLQELEAALAEVAADGDARCLVLEGQGADFSTGWVREGVSPEALTGSHHSLTRLVESLFHLHCPSIAVVRGRAEGAACAIAFACDLIYAEEGAVFHDLLGRHSPLPAVGMIHHLPRLVGVAQARRLALRNDDISAQEADSLGLINCALTPDALKERVHHLGRLFADGPPVALELAKRIVNRSFEMTVRELLEYEALAQNLAMNTRDHQEAAQAFLEKRTARFIGR